MLGLILMFIARHPETAILTNLGVRLLSCLYGVPKHTSVHSLVILDFAKYHSFPEWKQIREAIRNEGPSLWTLAKSILLSFCFLLLVIDPLSAGPSAEDKGRKEFWLNNYSQVIDGQLSARAHNVFDKVLAASDRRAGIDPKMYIIEYNGKPWAQSLADGSIIITRNALDFCYSNQSIENGDSRFAFIVGHELAHQFKGDFWPYKFLSTTKNDTKSAHTFQDIEELAKDPDMLLAKELQADQYGIIYAVLAGYNSDSIVHRDTNFFLEWAVKETPSNSVTDNLSLLAQKRVGVISLRLKEVIERTSLFHLGVISYYVGRHDEALALLKRFASYFPGREVYSNIGTIYLRMAYDRYLISQYSESFPYYLSFDLDLKSRAETIHIPRGVTRGSSRRHSLEYKQLLENAIGSFKKAVEFDPFYQLARNNLGCAYIIAQKYYDAVSLLEEALKYDKDNHRVQNNLAVAYTLLGKELGSDRLISQAEKMLLSAKKVDLPAQRNWVALQDMQGKRKLPATDFTTDAERSREVFIEFNHTIEFKPGAILPNDKKLAVVEEISGFKNDVLKVVKVPEKDIFLLAAGERIRLILYKEPFRVNTNIVPGETREVHLMKSARKGIVESRNKSIAYFEF